MIRIPWLGRRETYRLNAFTELFEGEKFGQILLDNNRLNLVVFNPETEEIIQWIA